MARTLIASDNFNRASLGSDWAQVNSSWGSGSINSSTRWVGAGTWSNCANNRWVGAGTFDAEQYAKATVVSFGFFGSSYRTGVGCRISADTDGSRDGYYYIVNDNAASGGTHGDYLIRIANGTVTEVASGSRTWTNGDTIELEVSGTGATVTLTAYQNGSVTLTYSDTDATRITATGAPGCAGSEALYLDDWEGGNLGASATTDQEGFRFGADDGSESAHTWLAAQDTNIYRTVGSGFLFRSLIDATGDPASFAPTLYAQKNGTGGYSAVPVGATTPVTLDYTIADGADDAQQIGTTMTVTGVTVGASLDATTEYVGLRFPNVAVPNGATITSAYLSVVPSGTGEDEPLVTITGFDEDNTAVFTTTASDITNRAVTTASASWSSTNLAATGATYHDTPSLVSVVQEIVDRAGWASGNAMGFRIQGGATATRDLTIESFENTGANPPKLHIEYTEANELYIATSSNVAAGGEATTARLAAPSGKTTGDFVTGRRWDDENGTDSIDIAADDYTEAEWSLNTQSPAVNGDYWDLRVYAGGSALTTYTVTPRLTMGTAPTPSNLPRGYRSPANVIAALSYF